MKITKYGFIGHEDTNTCFFWEHPGAEKQFEEDSKTMPSDWFFNTAEISYKINSLGHRSKELEETNLDNYILFTGCSHTEGTGMPVELTYPQLLANKFNCDYYNLALGATGIDVALHNLAIWFSAIEKKPKAVIIQWPDFTRTITGTASNLQPRGLWHANDDYNTFVNLGIDLEFFEAKKVMTHHLVQAMIKVPVVYFGLQKVIPFDDNTIIGPVIDKARDLAHPGIESHQLFAESIHDHLINTLCLSSYQNPEEKS